MLCYYLHTIDEASTMVYWPDLPEGVLRTAFPQSVCCEVPYLVRWLWVEETTVLVLVCASCLEDVMGIAVDEACLDVPPHCGDLRRDFYYAVGYVSVDCHACGAELALMPVATWVPSEPVPPEIWIRSNLDGTTL